jgi:hemoglobin-like flavoprotein
MIRQIQMFEKAINLTGPPESLYMTLENIGRRHAKYGVPSEYVRKMGQAFIFSVKQHFGKEVWTDGLQKAWEEIYSIIIDKMVLGIESVKS